MTTAQQSNQFSLSPREVRIAEACLEHATDLLEAAQVLMESDKHHLAFHMTVLCLEELGRRSLFLMNLQARVKDEPDIVNEAKTNDHVAKLYWSFFFPMVMVEKIDQAKLDEMRGLARALHLRRQEGLYLDTNRRPFRRPKNIISRAEAKGIVSLARSQVAMEKGRPFKAQSRIPREVRDLVHWFLQAGEDEDMRSFIFSEQSMAKLREFGNFADWVLWLRPAHEKEVQNFSTMAQHDHLRSVEGTRGDHPRWKFRLRLAGVSHRIKSSLISDWNQRMPWIQLELGSNKKQPQLFLTLTLSDRVPLSALYLSGKGLAERVILALNIGTLGFFWWESAQHTARFFDHLEDMDEGRPLVLSEIPKLEVDWFTRTLHAEDFNRVLALLSILPRINEQKEFEAFAIYLDGLSFLATINVHRRHEPYAMHAFYSSFWAAIEHNEGPLTGACERSHSTFLAALPGDLGLYEPLSNLYFKGQALEDATVDRGEITLEDVLWMKRICDFYFLAWAKRWQEQSPSPA